MTSLQLYIGENRKKKSEVVLKFCILNFIPSTLGNWEHYLIALTKNGQGSKTSV